MERAIFDNSKAFNFESLQKNENAHQSMYDFHLSRIQNFIRSYFHKNSKIVYSLVEKSVSDLDLLCKLPELAEEIRSELNQILNTKINEKLFSENANENGIFEFLGDLKKFASVCRSIFCLFEVHFLIFKNYHDFGDFFFELVKEIFTNFPDKTFRFIDFATRYFFKNVSEEKNNCEIQKNLLIFTFEKTGYLKDFTKNYQTHAFKIMSREFSVISPENKQAFISKLFEIQKNEYNLYERFFPQFQAKMIENFCQFCFKEYGQLLIDFSVYFIEAKQFENNRRVISIFDSASQLGVVKENLVKFIQTQVSSSQNLNQLLQILEDFYVWNSGLFAEFEGLSKDLNTSLSKIVNTENKVSPEFFAKRLDRFIGEKDHLKVTSCLKMLQILQDKEKYFNFIFIYFSKAVLKKNDSDFYLSVFTDLTNQYGDEMTKSFKNLMTDIKESSEFLEKHRSEIDPKVVSLSIIAKNHLKNLHSNNYLNKNVLDVECRKAVDQIEERFLLNSTLKKLDFLVNESTVEVEMNVGSFASTRILKLKHAQILLAFNNEHVWSISDLSVFLNTNQESLKKTLFKMNEKFDFFEVESDFIRLKSDFAMKWANHLNLKQNKAIDEGFDKSTVQSFNKEEVMKELERAIKAYIVKKIKTEKKVSYRRLLDGISEHFKISLLNTDISHIIDDLLANDHIGVSSESPDEFVYK